MKAGLVALSINFAPTAANLIVSTVAVALGTFVAASPIGRLRFGDRNDSPTWLLTAELRSYAGTVPSGSFFVW